MNTLPPELCRRENHPPFDFTDLGRDASPGQVETARGICKACPLLVACRKWSLRNDVAGFAGGMTRAERDAWARRHHVTPTALDIVDVTPASELTSAVLDDIPESDHGLEPRLVEVVLRMTAEGIPAEDIVAELSHTGLTHATVNYIRRTYAKGVSRVEV